MRIIAGSCRSRPLKTLRGEATRPTLDQVREAVFSSLGETFDGQIFLDLYAGSGAMGLEALSRGCGYCWFVDVSRAACGIIRENIRTLDMAEKSQVLNCRDTAALNLLARRGIQADLIYLDPPYEKQQNRKILHLLAEKNLVAEDGRVIIESARDDADPNDSACWVCYKEAVYGITRIRYYRKNQEEKL